MNLPNGYHREVVEARESIENTVDISPLNSGGPNFKTHLLVEKSSSKLAYKPSIGGVPFSLLLFIIGLGIIIYNLIIFLELTTNQPKLLNFISLAFGTVFAFAGGYIAIRIFKPRIFDKQIGLYY